MDLFEWSHARRTDPDTSHEAAATTNIPVQARIILASYRDGQALLDHDAYERAGMGDARAKSQRCSDLRQAGYIERTGERAKTPSGKSGHLCRITPRGLEFLAKRMVR